MIPEQNNLGDVDMESAQALSFLSKVAGKATESGYYFNGDGTVCEVYSNDKVLLTYNFHHAVNEYRAIYTTIINYSLVDSVFLVNEDNILKTGNSLLTQGVLK